MALLELEGFPEGSDITILDCYYIRSSQDENGKWLPDFAVILFIDNKTGKKHHRLIQNPDYTFYKIKDEFVKDYSQFFVPKDEVTPITVKYSHLEKEIAKVTGNLEFYEENIRNRNRMENRKLHTDPSIMFSDMTLEDNLRFRFGQSYTNNIGKLRKGFFDIECDILHTAGDFVELGECPVNAVTYMDEANKQVYTFILRNSKNPLIEAFENEIASGQFGQKDIEDFIIQAVTTKKKPGWKYATSNGLIGLNFNLLFFDDELEMIRSLFRTIHRTAPDFCMGWNSSSFDLAYLIERCYVLGGDPNDIFTDPSWKDVHVVRHYVDERNKNELAERGDYTIISGNTVFIDQMIQFASRRKSKIGSFTSFSLDTIGQTVAGIRKLDYSHITRDIAKLPYLDFKTFILYNIMDVIVQKCIENKNKDMEYIFAKAVVNNTSYKKVHRQTIYLINRMAKSFYNRDLIIGNNVNRWNEEPDKFLGALVGDPTRTNAYAKIVVDGVPITLCNNLQDYDYKSLYPSILIEFNISPNTQIGRIDIPEKVYQFENTYANPKYSRSGEFIENMVTDTIIEFCHRWFHWANIEEFLVDMNEFYQMNYMFGARHQMYRDMDKGLIHPLYDLPKEGIKAIVEFKPGEEWRPHAVYFYSTLSQNGMSTSYNDYKKSEDVLCRVS